MNTDPLNPDTRFHYQMWAAYDERQSEEIMKAINYRIRELKRIRGISQGEAVAIVRCERDTGYRH